MKRRDADSVFQNEDGSLFFIKPYERDETFRDLITYIQDQEKSSSKQRPVKYGQTREYIVQCPIAYLLLTELPCKSSSNASNKCPRKR